MLTRTTAPSLSSSETLSQPVAATPTARQTGVSIMIRWFRAMAGILFVTPPATEKAVTDAMRSLSLRARRSTRHRARRRRASCSRSVELRVVRGRLHGGVRPPRPRERDRRSGSAP